MRLRVAREDRRNRAIGLVLLISVSLVGCGHGDSLQARGSSTSQPILRPEGAGPSFDSVAALAKSSDVVAEVVIGKTIGTEVDRGGNPKIDPATGIENQGLTMRFFVAQVQKLLVGPADLSEVTVATLDVGQATEEGNAARLESGATMVLFLSHLTSKEAPGITIVSDFYSPVGGADGFFDVRDGIAYPRGPVVSLDGSSPVDSAVTSGYPLGSIEATVLKAG